MTRYRVVVQQTFKYELHLDADTEEEAAKLATESRLEGGPNTGIDLVRGVRSRLMSKTTGPTKVEEVRSHTDHVHFAWPSA